MPYDRTLDSFLLDRSMLLSLCSTPHPINRFLFENIILIKFIIEKNLCYPLIIDATNFIQETILEIFSTYKLVFERFTVLPNRTKNNIENTIQHGGILIIEEFDKELWDLIVPILDEWSMNRDCEIFDRIIQIKTNEEKKERFVDYFGKKIKIHDDFRLMVFLNDLNRVELKNEILNRFVVFNMDIKNEVLFQETVRDLLLKQLNLDEYSSCVKENKNLKKHSEYYSKDLDALGKEFEKIEVNNAEMMQKLHKLLENVDHSYKISDYFKKNGNERRPSILPKYFVERRLSRLSSASNSFVISLNFLKFFPKLFIRMILMMSI